MAMIVIRYKMNKDNVDPKHFEIEIPIWLKILLLVLAIFAVVMFF
jgi:hypothetical protein